MSVSNDGKVYVFKKSSKNILNIMLLTSSGFLHVKSIDISQYIENQFLKIQKGMNQFEHDYILHIYDQIEAGKKLQMFF